LPEVKRNWTRDELILGFNLYCRMPFGRLHRGSPEIIRLAKEISRTPSAVAMKLVNFASLDPLHQQRKVKGLKHASRQDREVWQEFNDNWDDLAVESQRVWAKRAGKQDVIPPIQPDVAIPQRPTESTSTTRVRLVQGFFRESVLSNYRHACTVCDLGLPSMLNAGHIIPWSVAKGRRADPQNGLCLCTFHDRAFDRGLITIDHEFRVVLSSRVKIKDAPKMHKTGFLEIEGRSIRLPDKFGPDPSALVFHRNNVFLRN